MPEIIQFKNGNQIRNLYDAGGQKLSTRNYTVYDYTLQPIVAENTVRDVMLSDEVFVDGKDYIGNVEYNYNADYYNGELNWEDTYFSKMYNSEGYCIHLNPVILFYYRRDHLGNNREVWLAPYTFSNGTTATATTVQRTQYYPSGLPWASNMGDNPWVQDRKYNGKEFVEMHGLDEDDSEARWYYPAIMRTTTIDPHAENYYSISPYAWCANNPVRMVDPDGRDPRKFKDWKTFGKSVISATTAVITFGLQGTAKVNVGSLAIGINSNPGSFDLIGIRNGNFTPNKNTPTIQSGGEVSLGIISLSKNTTITDNGATTTKTESTSGVISVFEGIQETTTEIDKKTNEVISAEKQSGVKISDVGVKASFIFGVEIKLDMKKVEDALKKLLNE